MFNFDHFRGCFKRREHGFIICAAGVGILLGVILPVWGWMFISACGLIIVGLFWSKKC